jgi:hypothetical protein
MMPRRAPVTGLCNLEILEPGLYFHQDFWIGFRLNLAWACPRGIVRFRFATLLARSAMLSIPGIQRLAVLALIVRNAAGSKFIARITKGILVLLGSVI